MSVFTEIQTDLSAGRSWTIQGDINAFSFAQGGVAIFTDGQETKVYIFDLVNMSGFKESDDTSLS